MCATMTKDTIVITLRTVARMVTGQLISIQNQANLKAPSRIIGFDSSGRITFQNIGNANHNTEIESFLPILSRRGDVEDNQILKQAETIRNQIRKTQDSHLQVQRLIQETLENVPRAPNIQTEKLIKQQTGPVSITIETNSGNVPLTNAVIPSTRGLGGVLVANEQISGKPCVAR